MSAKARKKARGRGKNYKLRIMNYELGIRIGRDRERKGARSSSLPPLWVHCFYLQSILTLVQQEGEEIDGKGILFSEGDFLPCSVSSGNREINRSFFRI